MTFFMAELNEAKEAIQRVRELAESWIDAGTKMLSIAPITDTHVEKWTAVVVSGKDILKALEGEQE